MKQVFMAFSRNTIAAFVVGVIFAAGLVLGGMTQPHKVIQFLDIGGNWDYSLIFVMIGGIAVHALAYPLIRKRKSPMFETKWHVPTRKDVTPSLILGSILFGVGWGLGGFCPGPAITSLVSGQKTPVVFVASMLVGMQLYKWVERYLMNPEFVLGLKKMVKKWKQSDISQAS